MESEPIPNPTDAELDDRGANTKPVAVSETRFDVTQADAELVERVARAIQIAVEAMPYPYVNDIWDKDADDYRPATLRLFYKDTWQGDHADEFFPAAAQVAAQAALAEVRAVVDSRAQAEREALLEHLKKRAGYEDFWWLEGWVDTCFDSFDLERLQSSGQP